MSSSLSFRHRKSVLYKIAPNFSLRSQQSMVGVFLRFARSTNPTLCSCVHPKCLTSAVDVESQTSLLWW